MAISIEKCDKVDHYSSCVSYAKTMFCKPILRKDVSGNGNSTNIIHEVVKTLLKETTKPTNKSLMNQ